MTKPYIHGMLPDVSASAEAQQPAAGQPQIRFLGDLQRLQPKPGDVFVLSCEQHIDAATAERIKAQLSGQLGGAKVLVLDAGLKLGVVAAAPAVREELVVHQNFTVGDVASREMVLGAIRSSQRYDPEA